MNEKIYITKDEIIDFFSADIEIVNMVMRNLRDGDIIQASHSLGILKQLAYQNILRVEEKVDKQINRVKKNLDKAEKETVKLKKMDKKLDKCDAMMKKK